MTATIKRLSRQMITKIVPIDKVALPKWAKEAIEKSGIEEPQLIRKGIVPSEGTQFKESERAAVDYITTKSVDRDGDIVVPNGAILDDYRKHPVVLFSHDYKSMPVGKAQWIKADEKGLIAKTQYHKKGKGGEIWDYRTDGFPMAKSIGFVPLSMINSEDFDELTDVHLDKMGLKKDDLTGADRIYPNWLMLEYSDVAVPSNPDALQLAISKGMFTQSEVEKAIDDDAFVVEIIEKVDKILKSDPEPDGIVEKEVITKPETTDNFHHIPIKSSGDFVEGSFKTIYISKSQGIKAVIGKLKSDPDGSTTTQKYMFSVQKWTMEEAQQWVSEHKDADIDTIKAVIDPEDSKNMLSERYEGMNMDIDIAMAPEEPEDNKGLTVEIESGDGEVIKMETDVQVVELLIDDEPIVKDSVIAESDDEIQDDPPETVSDEPKFKFKPVEKANGPWNQSLRSFDIEKVELQPSTALYAIASKWFDCKVKNIYSNSFEIPSALVGTFLTGLEETMKDHTLKDTRNFINAESPPEYEDIQLTAYVSQDFLVQGIQFYEKDGEKVIVTRHQSWYGMVFRMLSTSGNREKTKGLISASNKWMKENNFLRGQKFALSGQFLEKTDETWDDLFLTSTNEKSIKRSARLISDKGKHLANRGTLLLGPPGTGKTLAGRIIMNNIDSTFIWVSARDFSYSGAVGGISYGFRLARDLAPSVLFIEDIDNWLGGREVDLLKTEMDGISKSKGVVTFLTSNYPKELPPALIDRPGRFHDILNLNYPDNAAKTRMLSFWAAGIQEKTISSILKDTAGMSGAHIYELVAFAKVLMEDDEELTMDEAIISSLKRLRDQRDLAAELRGEKEPSAAESDPDDELSGLEIKDFTTDEAKSITEDIEKAGKVLSKTTRLILGKTYNSLVHSAEALKEFMDAVDSDEIDEPIEIEGDSPKAVDEPEAVIDVDKTELASMIKDVIKDSLNSQGKIDVGKLVADGVDKAKGKITY